MKKLLFLIIAFCTAAISFAQSPQKMSYQSVIRNAVGDLATETTVGIKISILQGTPGGSTVYQETHTLMTNMNGLASLEIGLGVPITGTFVDIDWSNGPYFIKCETDPEGGNSFSLVGVSELLSVPFALYANEAGNTTFTTNDNVTSNTEGSFAIDDFVFGSPELDDDGIIEHDVRMFFDKSKRAFRAGKVQGTQWDNINRGLASTAMGDNTIASGDYSTAIGLNATASGSRSIALGAESTASSTSAIALGYDSNASGERCIAMGFASNSIGSYSTTMGISTTALSMAETVIGSNNTSYSPLGGSDGWNVLDRLFVIGNGTLDSPDDAMVVLKNGNVGLGNSTPNEVLEVAGDGRAFFGNGHGDDRRGLLIDGIQGPTAARIEAYDYGLAEGIDLVFNSTPNGGNVGIGTNSPTARLSVNGTANKTGGGSWAVFSDRRLKKDINSYDEGLSTVLEINPVKFKYNGISKADTINQYIGVIAQELEKVSPYMINSIDINGTEYLEVDNSAMTYMLINAIKELHEVNDLLQIRISELEVINNNMDEVNAQLKSEQMQQKESIEANMNFILEFQSILKAQAKN